MKIPLRAIKREALPFERRDDARDYAASLRYWMINIKVATGSVIEKESILFEGSDKFVRFTDATFGHIRDRGRRAQFPRRSL